MEEQQKRLAEVKLSVTQALILVRDTYHALTFEESLSPSLQERITSMVQASDILLFARGRVEECIRRGSQE